MSQQNEVILELETDLARINPLAQRVADLEKEVADLRRELKNLAVLAAVHGVGGYTLGPTIIGPGLPKDETTPEEEERVKKAIETAWEQATCGYGVADEQSIRNSLEMKRQANPEIY